MKKLVNIFPIFVLIILNFLIITIEDMKERELYKKIDGYQSIGFVIPENVEHITNHEIDKLFDLAKQTQVVLVKTTYNEEQDSIEKYVSSDDVYGLFQQQFHFDDVNTNHYQSISTQKEEGSAYYLDLLNNDRYSFYPISSMKEKEVYPYGSYLLYYPNESSYLTFIKQAKQILQVEPELLASAYLGQLQEPIFIFQIGILFCIGFFILFYFLLTVFVFYKNTKSIGIFMLLGFSNQDILKKMVRKNIRYLLSITVILLFVSLFVLPNLKYQVLYNLIKMDLLIVVSTILLSYLALLFLQKFYTLSNILKKESLIKNISNLCLFSKCVMVGCMILIVVNCIPLIHETMMSTKTLKENELLMNYAVFPRLNVENGEYSNYNSYLEFYKSLQSHNIDHIYVSYGPYLEKDKETIENFENLEKNGDMYRIASVDLNYLNLYSLSCYTAEDTLVDIRDMEQEFYLLPKSKKNYQTAFRKKMQERYEQYHISYPVQVYYYDDQVFDTYDSQKGVQKVNSPIFRVVDKENPYTYFENSYGLDVAGTGMNTALKFLVNQTSGYYQTKLLPCIIEVGLSNALTEDNFVKYKDYYNELNVKVYTANIMLVGVLLTCFIIYFIMLFQTFVLYIDARKSKILAMSFMGFHRKEIFRSTILWNIGGTCIPISGICAYFATNTSELYLETLLFVICISIIFVFIEILILSIVTKSIRFTSIYTKLKGD